MGQQINNITNDKIIENYNESIKNLNEMENILSNNIREIESILKEIKNSDNLNNENESSNLTKLYKNYKMIHKQIKRHLNNFNKVRIK